MEEDIQIPVINDKISDIFLNEKSSNRVCEDSTTQSFQTPSSSDTLTDERIPNLPSIISIFSLGDIELPKIRQIGVKKSIESLALIFKCQNYQTNLIEFWFLDIVTDFLWRIQDEFELPDDIHKIMLSWLIFFINIIRDTENNYNKDEVFSILKEAIEIAGKCIDEGDPLIPNPSKLAEFIIPELNVSSSNEIKADGSELSVKSTSDDSIEYIEVEGKNEKKLYIFSLSDQSLVPSAKNLSSSSVSSGDDSNKIINENFNSFTNNITSINRKIETDSKYKTSIIYETDSEFIQFGEIAHKCEKAMQCLLDFVFEYFYNEFQFYVIKTVLTSPPKYKTEKLDITWQYPKTTKLVEEHEIRMPAILETDDPFEIAKRKISDNKKYLFPLNELQIHD